MNRSIILLRNKVNRQINWDDDFDIIKNLICECEMKYLVKFCSINQCLKDYALLRLIDVIDIIYSKMAQKDLSLREKLIQKMQTAFKYFMKYWIKIDIQIIKYLLDSQKSEDEIQQIKNIMMN